MQINRIENIQKKTNDEHIYIYIIIKVYKIILKEKKWFTTCPVYVGIIIKIYYGTLFNKNWKCVLFHSLRLQFFDLTFQCSSGEFLYIKMIPRRQWLKASIIDGKCWSRIDSWVFGFINVVNYIVILILLDHVRAWFYLFTCYT